MAAPFGVCIGAWCLVFGVFHVCVVCVMCCGLLWCYVKDAIKRTCVEITLHAIVLLIGLLLLNKCMNVCQSLQ